MARNKKMNNIKTVALWNREPQSEIGYISLGNELIAWAQKESSLSIDGFPISKMIAPSIFHALLDKSTEFSQAYDLALGIIGSRRERLAHEGMLNALIVRDAFI